MTSRDLLDSVDLSGVKGDVNLLANQAVDNLNSLWANALAGSSGNREAFVKDLQQRTRLQYPGFQVLVRVHPRLGSFPWFLLNGSPCQQNVDFAGAQP